MKLFQKFLILGCPLFFSSVVWASPVNIPLEKMQNFSGVATDEILAKREEAVQSSIVFSSKDYRPSPSVFQIEDKAPWISAHEISCYGTKNSTDISRGPSRESIGILNPELLFYINILNFEFYKTTGCSPVDYLIPSRVSYDNAKNLITAHVNYSAFYKKNKHFYGIILEDVNARDLGYDYVWAENVRNITFKDSDNLSTSIIKTSGFFHLGGSCGLPSGCNNYSPYQIKYHFYLEKLPASLTIKLWRNYPSSQSDTADITYKLIFE